MKKDIRQIDTSNMTDEEIDEFYRPQKSNNRKSLSPLYVYKILTELSSPARHFTQQEILAHLNDLYEIELERKAVGRIIHTLSEEGLGIVYTAKDGAWYDPDR